MSIEERLAALQKMTTAELKAEWRVVFDQEPRSGNVPWMRKRLAWGIQAQVLGGLSEAAERRIEKLTPVALAWLPFGRRSFPSANGSVPLEKGDDLPPGTVITRVYKGRTLQLLVCDDGRFELDGAIYPSLSAAAQGATGSHWNGRLFWFGRERKAG